MGASCSVWGITNTQISDGVGVGFALDRTDEMMVLFVGKSRRMLSRDEALRLGKMLINFLPEPKKRKPVKRRRKRARRR